MSDLHARIGVLVAIATFGVASGASAQNRRPWETHPGEDIVVFTRSFPRHADAAEYDFATIPPMNDLGWGPIADDGLSWLNGTSSLCGMDPSCNSVAQFTYYRTAVCVPNPAAVQSLEVSIGAVDDGARVSLVNSAFPAGFVPTNAFAFLGFGPHLVGDLAPALRAGEPNYVVITQVDDCCEHTQITEVRLLLNGAPVPLSGGGVRETCNGLDDDCDGRVDELLGSTTCGVGACGVAVANCLQGVPQICRPNPPSSEVCDGIDNDCDGIVDNAEECDAGVELPPEPMPEPTVEPVPDAAIDVPGDFSDVEVAVEPGVDVRVRCTGHNCDPDLRLEGRAGPLGACVCRAGIVGSGRSGRLVIALFVVTLAGRRLRIRKAPR